MASDYRNLSRDELIRLLEASGPQEVGSPVIAEAERYRNLVEQASDGIFIADQQGVYLDVNDSGARMLGMTRSEVIGRRIIEIVTDDEVARIGPELAELRAGKVIVQEHRIKRKDGSTFPGEVSAKQLSDGRVQGILRDITLRKQAEANLRQSEERFRQLTAAAFEGIGISEAGRIVDVNDQLARMLGYEREAIVGREVMTLIAPESRGFVAEAMKSGQEGPYEHLALRKDGTVFLAEVQAKAVTWRGRPVRVTAIRDITRRKQTEQALHEGEERFRVVAEQTGQLIYDYDVSSGRIRWAGAVQRVTGFTVEEFQRVNIDVWAELIHPDDRAHALERLDQATKAACRYCVEYRFRRKDGSYVYVEDNGNFLLNEHNQPHRMLGTMADITVRHRAESERSDAMRREQQAHDEYTRQLIASQEAQRRRIAAELHDSFGQNLLLIKNRVQLALKSTTAPPELRGQLESISEIASLSLDEVRQISHDLRPYQLDQLGLTGALKVMIEAAAQSTGIKFEHKLELVDDVFNAEDATNVYRVVQEGLNNIFKHSRAPQARIELERDVRHVRLRIEDNGDGFDPAQARGFGLKNIAERVRILGGSLTVHSTKKQGTRIEVTIPITGEK